MANEKPFCMFSYEVIPFLKMAENETEKAYYFDLFIHYVAAQKPEYEEPAEEPAKPENFSDDNKSKIICQMIKKSLKAGESFYLEKAAKENETASIGGLKAMIKNRYPADDLQAAQLISELDERLKDLKSKRGSYEEYLNNWGMTARKAVQEWEAIRADSLPVMPDNANIFESSSKWFETFWGEYLKKTGRDEAEKEFKKVCTSESSFDEIMAGLRRLNDKDYRHKDVQFLPNPATWLKGRRWNDVAIPPAKGNHVPDFIYAQERGEYDNEEDATPQDINAFYEHIQE